VGAKKLTLKPKTELKKRRKPKSLRKENWLRIRVTDDQKDALVEAARADGSQLSSWLLALGMREARRTAADRAAATGSKSTSG
jgi:uncharacterized protein (DUF1778 family)